MLFLCPPLDKVKIYNNYHHTEEYTMGGFKIEPNYDNGISRLTDVQNVLNDMVISRIQLDHFADLSKTDSSPIVQSTKWEKYL